MLFFLVTYIVGVVDKTIYLSSCVLCYSISSWRMLIMGFLYTLRFEAFIYLKLTGAHLGRMLQMFI